MNINDIVDGFIDISDFFSANDKLSKKPTMMTMKLKFLSYTKLENYIKSMNDCSSYNDWRLPTFEELEIIAKYSFNIRRKCMFDNIILYDNDILFNSDFQVGMFWTSTINSFGDMKCFVYDDLERNNIGMSYISTVTDRTKNMTQWVLLVR